MAKETLDEPTVQTVRPPPTGPRWKTILLVLVLAGGGGAMAYHFVLSPPTGPDAGVLDGEIRSIEARTAELQRELDALAEQVRRGLFTRFARAFADEMSGTTPLPATPASVVSAGRGIKAGHWSLESPRGLSGREMAERLERLVSRFALVTDVRFELVRSSMRTDAATLDGALQMAIAGRDREGRREWVRGEASVVARRTGSGDGGPTWRLAELRFTALDSLVAEQEMFTEVTAAAGLPSAAPADAKDGALRGPAGGAAVADVDLDGRLDVVIASGASRGRARLWRGLADGTFEELAAPPFRERGAHAAPLFLDVDGDGDPDLFLVRNGRPILLENRIRPDGELSFVVVPHAFDPDLVAFARSACAGDVNGDGHPDLYVACGADPDRPLPVDWTRPAAGGANLLLLGRGDGTFEEAAEAWGVAEAGTSSAAAVLYDADGDGDLDLHVVHELGAEPGVFRNEGDRFADARAERGIDVRGGWGASVGDVDADGRFDLFVTRTSSRHVARMLARLSPEELPARDRLASALDGNALVRAAAPGRGDRFPAGWAWSGRLVDVDGDGHDDLHAVAGGRMAGGEDVAPAYWHDVVLASLDSSAGSPRERPGREGGARGAFAPRQRDRLDLNRGDGTFLDVSGVSGLDDPRPGRASVAADFDDDGDLDLLVVAADGSARLYRNDFGGESWIRVALEGGEGDARDAFGATVRAGTSFGTITRVKDGGSGFAAQSDPRMLFGLGGDQAAAWVDVTWPGGEVQRVENVPAGRSIRIRRGVAEPVVVEEEPTSLGGTERFDLARERERRAESFHVELGEPLPDVEVRSLEGARRRLPEVEEPGRFVLVYLFRPSATGGLDEIAELERLHAGGTRSVRVVLLSDEPEDVIARLLGTRRLGMPIYRLAADALAELVRDPNRWTAPALFVLDRRGRMIDVRAGWSADLRAKYLR